MFPSIGKKLTIVIVAVALIAPALSAQTEVTTDLGEIVGVEKIKLEGDGSVTGAAVMGGMIGLTYGKANKKSRAVTRRRTAAGAAAAATLAKRRGGGAQEAMEYTVRMLDGQTIRFVTDQDDVRMADCVIIEQSGDSANLRRVSDRMCEADAQPVVQELQEELVDEARECIQAKEQLLAAETDADFSRAMTKVTILCDD